MDELLMTLRRYFLEREALSQSAQEWQDDSPEMEARRKSLAVAKNEFAAVLERSIDSRIEEIVEAKLEACAAYAKSKSMPDVASCFRRRYSQ